MPSEHIINNSQRRRIGEIGHISSLETDAGLRLHLMLLPVNMSKLGVGKTLKNSSV